MALRQDEFTSLTDDVDLDRDRALVERCQAGDSAAFGNLYARYYERLLRFCLRRLNDRHEAEDAAQEAFARAWKALPQFAGERRFYPWLTVIAGNICTDMLRRRSRSTPTDDVELGSHQRVGGGGSETSEELVLAAVDGELVNRALGRLSTRHRHVLAMREGSGWTYQQIADHEGVEIGTIETLLWRARQALKREFAVLSESKGVLGGFLAGASAFFKRSMFRVAHRTSMVQGAGTGGGLRNAMIGGAVTSAAVAAALITPHALSTPHSTPPVQAISVPSVANNAANPALPVNTAPPPSTNTSSGSDDFGGGASDSTAPTGTGTSPERSNPLRPSSNPTLATGSGNGTGTGGVNAPSGGPSVNVPGLSGLGTGITTPVVKGLSQVTTSLTNSVGSIASSLGLAQVLAQLGLVTPTASSTTSTTNPLTGAINTVTGAVGGAVNKTLQGVLGKK